MFEVIWHKWLKRPHKLFVTERGQGQTVLLLHGVGASWTVWRPLITQLDEEKWQILAPDLLGFGASPKPQWSRYNVQDHAKAVVTALRSRRIRGPITIVGHSMGCLVAVHIAAIQPRLIKRLVLYEPPLYADDPEFTSHAKRRAHYFALYEFIAAHPQLAFTQTQAMWRIAKRLIGLRLTTDMWVPFQRSLRNTIMRQAAYTQLHSIQVPTDIIHGRFDVIVTRRDLRKMYTKNRHITWHTVNDVHGLSWRSAKYLARLLNHENLL